MALHHHRSHRRSRNRWPALLSGWHHDFVAADVNEASVLLFPRAGRKSVYNMCHNDSLSTHAHYCHTPPQNDCSMTCGDKNDSREREQIVMPRVRAKSRLMSAHRAETVTRAWDALYNNPPRNLHVNNAFRPITHQPARAHKAVDDQVLHAIEDSQHSGRAIIIYRDRRQGWCLLRAISVVRTWSGSLRSQSAAAKRHRSSPNVLAAALLTQDRAARRGAGSVRKRTRRQTGELMQMCSWLL